ncbi:MAG TPA: 50S ribosomal protein L3 [Candidatus Saccharimonadales bacterium]|nr:50S ribosomal protein L3 [Candidatus Saccharimonadales bacterium]
MKALLGTKIGMTQILQEDGVAVPVTIIQAGPCTVTQVKSVEKDGYSAVQIGYGQGKNLSNATKGHVKAANANPNHLREVRVDELPEGVTVGSNLDVTTFEVGEQVDVTGTSKGKGFAGNIKRHNFNAQPRSHGSKAYARRPGSIGSMYPQRVFKGKKMAGRMGGDQVTVKNLEIALIDVERNLIGVKGAIPGPRRGLVMIGGTK